jgi:hypothetical protein
MANNAAYDSERGAAEASLRKHSGIFTSRGFKYRGLEVEHSKFLPNYNVFTFVNPDTGRMIEISHVPPFDSRGRTFVFHDWRAFGQDIRFGDIFAISRPR